MAVLNQTLIEEQNKVNEVKQQIELFKDQMAKQNQEISKRLAAKEQRETQVRARMFPFLHTDFFLNVNAFDFY